VAVVLNVVPGLGAVYLYQRHCKAGKIENAETDQCQLAGLIGMLLLASVTANS
jgi:hypothetical protein